MTNYGDVMRQLKAQMDALESEMKASQNEIVLDDRFEEELERTKADLERVNEENEMLRKQIDKMSTVIKNQRAMSNIHFGFSEMVRHWLSRMDMEISELRKRGEVDEEDDSE